MNLTGFNLQTSLPVMGFEKLTISTAVVPLSASVYQTVGTGGSSGGDIGASGKYRVTAKAAFVTVEANGIRVRLDGTDPDASTGHLFLGSATATASFWLTSQAEIQRFKAIRSAAADAIINVTYYGA